MGSIKIKTDSGIRMSAKLDSRSDFEKIIKFLQAERDAMTMPAKSKKQTRDEIITDIGTGYYEAQRRAK